MALVSFNGYPTQRYKKEAEFGQNIQKTKVFRNKKTSKLSRTPRLCKKSLKGFSFKLHQCYPKINLSFYLKNKLQLPILKTSKSNLLPLHNLPIFSQNI
ncbi:hypothetical protein [uncultured Bacteroides sp.]|uniref:hypothetical protein n=1 Tax=uncultured Bacteroides sp. TaxID=162156 RepID=UPI0025DE073B|nr:hypothetical protein [uncultured Bacteroides sp.]